MMTTTLPGHKQSPHKISTEKHRITTAVQCCCAHQMLLIRKQRQNGTDSDDHFLYTLHLSSYTMK